MIENALRFSHTLLKNTISPGDIVVDATVGNGDDTVLLAKLVGPHGKVYGFDIQDKAIQKTKEKLLYTSLLPQVELYHQGHETVGDVLEANTPLAGAIFNLGYLPKSDKSIITKSTTTLKAIVTLLPLLRKGALLIVVVYYGHNGGTEEKEAVLDFASHLPQKEYSVLQYGFINQQNSPPFLLAIEKR
ncbi:class I SAM-dependent methyltransferase [Desemzia sp. FAM 24101]|uniref:class I SAM-dependent methyltransferase n=1 Tax=unclassified Desemzia TaxID=2685243 RepID=UPI00388372AD